MPNFYMKLTVKFKISSTSGPPPNTQIWWKNLSLTSELKVCTAQKENTGLLMFPKKKHSAKICLKNRLRKSCVSCRVRSSNTDSFSSEFQMDSQSTKAVLKTACTEGSSAAKFFKDRWYCENRITIIEFAKLFILFNWILTNIKHWARIKIQANM